MRMILTSILMFVMTFAVWGEEQKNLNREIENNAFNLREVQRSLKEKRLEKEKALLEERTIRREMTRIEKELNRLQKVSEKLRREIVAAERKLKASEKSARVAENEKSQWASLLEHETDLWCRGHCSYERILSEPVAEKLRFQALARKMEYYGDAKVRESGFRDAAAQWKNAQSRLLKLKGRQDRTARDQADVKKQKQGLLKTATGRRIVAEDDIRKLLESARALQQLIIKLERERKMSEAGAPEKKRPASTVKKHEYPWPLSGKVVTRFGKNKHPELETCVISNGIKIQGSAGAAIHIVDDGDVVFSGEFRSYGLMAIIDHGGGIYSIYGQLGKLAVQEDQKVKAGTAAGVLPDEDKPLLYFEIRSDGQPEDPLQWLK